MNTNVLLVKALRLAGYKPGSYSGNHMTSRECVAGVVTDDSPTTVCLRTALSMLKLLDEVNSPAVFERLMTRDVNVDVSGEGETIVYFNGMDWDEACQQEADKNEFYVVDPGGWCVKLFTLVGEDYVVFNVTDDLKNAVKMTTWKEAQMLADMCNYSEPGRAFAAMPGVYSRNA